MATKELNARAWGTCKRTGIPYPIGHFGCEYGDVYHVDYERGSDSYRGITPGTAFKTYSKAYDKATSNQNDAILINGYSTVVETAMIDWTKNRIHTFGCNGPMPIFGYGAGAKVQLGVTTDTSDIAIIKVTGVRNSWTGIKFDSANTLTQSAYAVADGGEYSRWNFCEFYKSTHLTTAAAAELLCNSDSGNYCRCTFGDLVNHRDSAGSGSIQRPNVLFNRETITGKVARDVTFEKCHFLVKAGHADVCMTYGSGATDIERRMVMDECVYWNCVLGGGTVADAVNFGAAQTTGDVLLIKPAGVNITAIAGASLNIYVASETAQTTDGVSEEIAA